MAATRGLQAQELAVSNTTTRHTTQAACLIHHGASLPQTAAATPAAPHLLLQHKPQQRSCQQPILIMCHCSEPNRAHQKATIHWVAHVGCVETNRRWVCQQKHRHTECTGCLRAADTKPMTHNLVCSSQWNRHEAPAPWLYSVLSKATHKAHYRAVPHAGKPCVCVCAACPRAGCWHTSHAQPAC